MASTFSPSSASPRPNKLSPTKRDTPIRSLLPGRAHAHAASAHAASARSKPPFAFVALAALAAATAFSAIQSGLLPAVAFGESAAALERQESVLKAFQRMDAKVDALAKAAELGSVDLARRESGGFFTDVPDEHWRRLKARARAHVVHHPGRGPGGGAGRVGAPQWYQENYEPDFACLHERRVGTPPTGDGPKWVCDPHRLRRDVGGNRGNATTCLVYSVGSDGNFMFEEAVRKTIGPHCEIHTFDPEMSGKRYGDKAPSGVHYHDWGFAPDAGGVDEMEEGRNMGFDRRGGTFKSFRETVEELGHAGRVIDIFKIDCEGCEWTTYNDWFAAGATLRQILVEVHNAPAEADAFFRTLRDQGYVTFHKEPNIQYAGGSCVEYAFLKLEPEFFA